MTINFDEHEILMLGFSFDVALITVIFCCENNQQSLTKINLWWFFNEIFIMNLGPMMPISPNVQIELKNSHI
jgi:hypothetical protein